VQKYLDEVARDFERYAKETYPPVLADPKAEDEFLLAALRYVETRRVEGHDDTLKERFTTRRSGKLARALDAACLDALLATSKEKSDTARLLATVGSLSRPLPVSELCAEGLKRLGPLGCEVLLEELASCDEGLRRRKLALLLSKASGVRMPEPLRFWKDADPAEIQAATQVWRAALVADGQLPPAPPGDVNTNAVVDVTTNGE
jgi:hypothetical protein